MTDWDGNSPHTMQDEYELARELGVEKLTTDDDGQMIPAESGGGVCPHCRSFVGDVQDHIDYLRGIDDPEHRAR